MKRFTDLSAGSKLLGVAMPVATVIVLVALLFVGGTQLIGPVADLLSAVFDLAVLTLYAIAIGGSAAVAMHMTGGNLPNRVRRDLVREAELGSVHAFRLLVLESASWVAWAVVWGWVYLVAMR